jgi:hypothetical protein
MAEIHELKIIISNLIVLYCSDATTYSFDNVHEHSLAQLS